MRHSASINDQVKIPHPRSAGKKLDDNTLGLE